MSRVCVGLWALNGFSIPSAGLVERQSDGTNLQGVAVLPNYSLVTFALVRAYLNILFFELLTNICLLWH